MREGGRADGKIVGVLGIHFDWQPQARAVVEGIRLAPEEKARSRALLTDAHGLVIASSDGRGVLSEHLRLQTGGQASGNYVDGAGQMVAFHRTPGYETYEGLGWYGVIQQRPEL